MQLSVPPATASVESGLTRFLLGCELGNHVRSFLVRSDVLASNNNPASRSVHIVRLDIANATSNPSDTAWQDHLFERCIPYIAKAFHELLEDMPQESRRQHQQHLISGDDLFIAVLEEEVTEQSTESPYRPIGHALFSLSHAHDTAAAVIHHCNSMVVDPRVQGAGVGGRLFEAALTSFKSFGESRGGSTSSPLFISARTQNDAILKVFLQGAKTVCRPEAVPAAVFPCCMVPSYIDQVRYQKLANIARSVADQFYPGVTYDEARGVMPKAYPLFLRKVFGGTENFPTKSMTLEGHQLLSHYMDVSDGDAAIVVVEV